MFSGSQMLEIRFHGRGGAGSVLASRALAKAAFCAGKKSVTFPSFGAERRGAPVLAFTRIDTKKIYKRTQIYEPDIIAVLDSALIEFIDVAKGLKDSGIGVLNSSKKADEIKLSKSINVGVVDATKIANEILEKPITNSALLGALIKSSSIVEFSFLEKAIMSVFGSKLGEKQAKKNVEVARIAYDETSFGMTRGGRNYNHKKQWLPTIQEFPIGTVIPKITLENGESIGPGSAITRFTGTWSHYKARINQEKCIQCLKCMFHCPEGTIHRNGSKLKVDIRYCKGCRICENVCPVNAIEIEEISDFNGFFY